MGNTSMALVRIAGLLLLYTAAISADAPNCNPYSHARASSCSSSRRNHDSFRDMATALSDAHGQEHMDDFVLNITLGMYKFLHPCESTSEAALVLFFGEQPPDLGSDWWAAAEHVLNSGGLIGRRRRDTHFDSEEELLRTQLAEIMYDTGRDGSCVAYLIEHYKGYAGQEFRKQYPNFSPPTPKPTTTTTATTTTTTTAATTTTTAATTSTTTATTTTTAATTTTTTTTALPATTVAPAKCTTCSMLECLLSPHVTDCAAGQEFCLTAVTDTANGREITRGCTTRAHCEHNHNVANCNNIEDTFLPQGTRCDICCSGENCNRPPSLLPDQANRYPLL